MRAASLLPSACGRVLGLVVPFHMKYLKSFKTASLPFRHASVVHMFPSSEMLHATHQMQQQLAPRRLWPLLRGAFPCWLACTWAGSWPCSCGGTRAAFATTAARSPSTAIATAIATASTTWIAVAVAATARGRQRRGRHRCACSCSADCAAAGRGSGRAGAGQCSCRGGECFDGRQHTRVRDRHQQRA